MAVRCINACRVMLSMIHKAFDKLVATSFSAGSKPGQSFGDAFVNLVYTKRECISYECEDLILL